MAVLKRYAEVNGYYIIDAIPAAKRKSRKQTEVDDQFVTYQVTWCGVGRLLRAGVDADQQIPAELFFELLRAGDIYTKSDNTARKAHIGVASGEVGTLQTEVHEQPGREAEALASGVAQAQRTSRLAEAPKAHHVTGDEPASELLFNVTNAHPLDVPTRKSSTSKGHKPSVQLSLAAALPSDVRQALSVDSTAQTYQEAHLTRCPKCGVRGTAAQIKAHVCDATPQACSQPVGENAPTAASERAGLLRAQVVCPYCKRYIPQNEIQDHMRICVQMKPWQRYPRPANEQIKHRRKRRK